MRQSLGVGRVTRAVASRRHQCRTCLSRSLAGLLLAALTASDSVANPQGPQVVHGQVGFNQAGPRALTITNSPNAIVNWQSFSIGADEVTRFIQEHAGSAILNRVTGQDPSSILGQLSSNGRVFLINPNGMVFGAGAVIDTAGFVGSTLNIADEDFLAGRLSFEGGPDAGAIRNQGLIRSRGDGGVYLIAPSIENSGIVHTESGLLLLAAGHKVQLSSLDLDSISVEVQAPEDEAVNLGELLTGGGALGVFAGAIRNHGVMEASAITVDEGGEIRLVAAGDINVPAPGRIAADGAKGGSVHIESASGTTTVRGTVHARGLEQGGGEVRLLGERVGLFDEAVVDASGETGGGQVLIGGDYKGANTQVRNARHTAVGAGAAVRADAIAQGDGGRVIVWADETTSFRGTVSARGGALAGGDGGFAEVSGRQTLIFTGDVDLTGPTGQAGTLLLDPQEITIGAVESASIQNTLNVGTNVAVIATDRISLVNPITISNTPRPGPTTLTLSSNEVTLDSSIGVSTTSDPNFGPLVVSIENAQIVNLNSDITTGSFVPNTDGGAINILNSGQVTISQNATLSSGAITIEANSITNNGDIFANTGGNVGVTSQDSILNDGTIGCGVFGVACPISLSAGTSILGAGIIAMNRGTLSLSAGTDINVTTQDLATVAAGTLNGDISLSNTGDGLEVGTVGLLSGISNTGSTTVNPQISLSNTGGDITINQPVLSQDQLMISASGTDADVFVNAAIDASSLAITAAGDVLGDGMTAMNAGTLSLFAGGEINFVVTQDLVTVAARALDGDIVIRNAGGRLEVGTVGTLSGITNTGSTTIDPLILLLNTGGGITISQPVVSQSEITVATLGTDADLFVNAALQAPQHVAATTAGADADLFVAAAIEAGSVQLETFGADADLFVNAALRAASNRVSLGTHGASADMFVNAAIETGGDVSLRTDDADADVFVNGTIQAADSVRVRTVSADSDVFLRPGADINVALNSLNFRVGGRIVGEGGLLSRSTVNPNDGVSLQAGAGIGSAVAPIRLSNASNLRALANADGIYLQEEGTLLLVINEMSTNTGGINVGHQNTTIEINGPISTGNGSVAISAAGDLRITEQGGAISATDTIDIRASDDIETRGSIVSADRVSLINGTDENDSITVIGETTIAAAGVELGGPVTGSSPLTLRPATATSMAIGSEAGGFLPASSAAQLRNFRGGLSIGGSITNVAGASGISLTADDILLATELRAEGDLALVSSGDIRVSQGGVLGSDSGTLTLAAGVGTVEGTGAIMDAGAGPSFFFEAPEIVFIANGAVGTLANPLTVLSSPSTVSVGSGTGVAFVDGEPGNTLASDARIESIFNATCNPSCAFSPNVLRTVVGVAQEEALPWDVAEPEPEPSASQPIVDESPPPDGESPPPDYNRDRVLKLGPQLLPEFNMSDFSAVGLVKAGWPILFSYQTQEQGTLRLSLAVEGVAPFVFEGEAGTGEQQTMVVPVPKRFGSAVVPAVFTVVASRDFADPKALVEAQVLALGVGPKVVGSAAIERIRFQPPLVRAGAGQTAAYRFFSKSAFDNVTAEFMKVTPAAPGEKHQKVNDQLIEGGVRRDQWVGEKERRVWNGQADTGQLSVGRHKLQVRAWDGVGQWITAWSKRPVTVQP